MVDIAKARNDFPMLTQEMQGKPLVYLDTAATAHKPSLVIDTMTDFLKTRYGTVHRAVYDLAIHATEAYHGVREKIRLLLNAAKPEEIIFTRGTTESINLVASSFGKAFFFLSWPEIALLTAAVSSVYGWILLRQFVAHKGVGTWTVNGYAMAIGGVLTLIYSRMVETWNPLPVWNTVGFLETGIALLIISNLICYNLYGHLLKKYTATFMSFSGFSTPIFVAIFGWIFLKEVVPWEFWLSFSILFVGLFIFHRE
ncbi:aminotransferase class V-fold PLP-dependent enzyme, partial [Simkania negevensis]|nr:aminotransferase class V-fold PLP-dependent enzyme [Simkania negevensis]